MAAAILQGVGATTALAPVNYKNHRRSLPVRKRASFVIHCDGSLLSGSKTSNKRLSANAVSTKQDNVAASTASKPGHELLLFEALREGRKKRWTEILAFVLWVKMLATMEAHTR